MATKDQQEDEALLFAMRVVKKTNPSKEVLEVINRIEREVEVEVDRTTHGGAGSVRQPGRHKRRQMAREAKQRTATEGAETSR